MSRKPKQRPDDDLSKDLWVNPRFNMRGPDGNRGWETGRNIPQSSGSRFLELADIALGLKKPAAKRKRAASATAAASGVNGSPFSRKTEPYSR